ncbi:lysylphosphatidylglycerol synthase transmembrane domain-containing protein [Glaciihabitans sp. dw_435]|uniref:lysylphosphatidylglycerol synthase transmembrane domain-containing protein n=1 Tax=Glaciihabitans sp. dw_435 TaxID=2720081 RepID=UPI001BD53CA2|nr:lysylphosphatidylglycerol synthase transmembrane domain-containing protein [Glaciihabitans sp. dw_435]
MKRVLKTGVPIAFYVLLIAFLVYYVSQIEWSTLANIQFDWWFFIVACVLGLTSRYWSAYIWIVILRSLGAKQAVYQPVLIYVYAKSWLGRYIPGTAPWILGKIFFASKQGISKNKLAVSSLLEAALQIVVQLALSIALLLFDPRIDLIPEQYRFIKWLMVLVLIGCIVAIIPPVFNRLMGLAYKLLRRGTFEREHHATWRTISSGAGLYLVGSIINGLSLFFIAKTVVPDLPYSTVFYVMGVGTLAGVAGMLIVFAPGGLGVREIVQAPLLGALMPAAVAAVVVVISRLWSVLMDLLFFAAAWSALRIRGEKEPELVGPPEPQAE